MPKHIVILLILLAGFLGLALLAKSYLTDPSFYEFGDYRADAVPEIASDEPLLRDGTYCLTCHSDGFAFGSHAAHGAVQCEVCHGVDPGHPDNPATSVPTNTVEICTLCHEAMPARPTRQPQIVSAEHPSAEDAGQQCHSCHDPHAPGGLETPSEVAVSEGQGAAATDSSADLLAIVSKCEKCHGKFGEGRARNPAIAGLEPGEFVDLLNQYASGARENKLMNKYAGALSTEEIAELSKYYENLAAESPE